jgi:hypothetical protein
MQHETDPRQAAGRGLAGRGVPGVYTVVAGAHLRGGGGTLHGRCTHSPWPQTGRLMGDTGWRPTRSAGITSIAERARRSKPAQAASVGGQSNQELKLHLAVGGWGARA